MTLRNLCLIPARGGSKRIPGKNLKPLGNEPLLNWTITPALNSGVFSDIVLSSDSPQILDYGKKKSITAIDRDDLHSGDDDTLLGYCLYLADSEFFDGFSHVYLCVPTSPFRLESSFQAIAKKFENSSCQSIVSCACFEYPPEWALCKSASGKLFAREPDEYNSPRSKLSTSYKCDGAYIAFSVEWFLSNRVFVGGDTHAYESNSIESIDIDTQEDLAYAEFLVSSEKITLPPFNHVGDNHD